MERDTPAAASGIAGAGAIPVGDAFSRLDFLTVLRVSGTDAHAYLQGQLTADVDEVGVSRTRFTAWCSPRGRVLALFRLFTDPACGYRLVCERWFAAALLARLRMFILRSDVRIDDAGDRLQVAGIAGTRAVPDEFAAWAGTAGIDDAAVAGEVTIGRVPGRQHRFLVTGPAESVASIAASATGARVRRAEPCEWRLEDICAGIARICADSSDVFLPQMLNLDRLRAVSFEKGCYVGQEIVARTQHLGRVKRRAYVARTTAAAEGDPIVDTAQNDAPKVGDVVAVEPHPGGDSAAFVVVNAASARSPALRAGGPDGAPIRLSSPEYPTLPD